MTGKDRIQHALITYLLNNGSISLKLPDEVELEIGITQETKHGIVKSEGYCWVLASRGNKSVELDSYNLGLNFSNDKGILMFEDKEEDRVCLNVAM